MDPHSSSGGSFLREARGIATVLRLLVLLVAALLGLSTEMARPQAYWTVTCVYALSVLAPMFMPSGKRISPRWGTVIFLFDVIALSCIIVLRGHDMQGLLVATFALMLLAATLEGLGNALANVLLVGGAFVAVTQWGLPTAELLSASNLAQLAFFVVTGTLMGYAADQARNQSAARRNAERRRRRAQVALYSTSRSLQQSEARLEEAQASLRANERLYTLGLFAAGVNHELGNPVAVILAAVEAAGEILSELEPGEDGAPQWAELSEAHDACRLAGEQLRSLIDELGRMTRAGRGEGGEADAGAQVEVAARLLQKLAGPRCEVVTDTRSTRAVQADAGRLLQVLLNLGKNALDAIGDARGRIVLRSRDAGDGQVELEVQDDGPGIPEELRERIFEAFVTTKAAGSGTGLGLHLVQEIVTSQRGTIELESRLGTGTRFRVRLPAAPEGGSSDGTTTDEDTHRRRRGQHSSRTRAHTAT